MILNYCENPSGFLLPLTSLNNCATLLLLGKSIKYSNVVIYTFDYPNTPPSSTLPFYTLMAKSTLT